MGMQGANMEEIIKMAQKVATNIAQNNDNNIDPQNMDMANVISQVTNSVSQMITPEMIEKMSGGSINSEIIDPKEEAKKFNSKINFDQVPDKKSKKIKFQIIYLSR